jgi:hypothetical protein
MVRRIKAWNEAVSVGENATAMILSQVRLDEIPKFQAVQASRQ